MVADAEAGGDRAERMLRAARELSDVREADDEAGVAAQLVAALQRVAAEIGTLVTPTELMEALHERGYAWVKSLRGLAGLLGPLRWSLGQRVKAAGRAGSTCSMWLSWPTSRRDTTQPRARMPTPGVQRCPPGVRQRVPRKR